MLLSIKSKVKAMKIADLEAGMSNISLVAEVTDISEVREVNTRYGRRRVADATLEDDTGTIKLSLWGEQIDEVKVGDKIKLSGCFVTQFKNNLQLNLPRSGKIEKL